jgi:hypothetical protein|mmetsp:Transcript_29969/g.39830  ORF Transcript_29969/g.39830 Transcript_29969/m.39830 type:complete len:561 (+) Transcript_29969:96-1778(+)
MKVSTALCLLFGTASVSKLGMAAEIVEQFSEKHENEGYFDALLETVNEDGRHEHVTSVFEQRRQWKEARANGDDDHPILKAAGDNNEYIDAFLDLIWDWNHIINVRLHKATKTSRLIPTTGMSDMMLMHDQCDKCWSMHGAKWAPDAHLAKKHGGEGAPMVKKYIEYFYMMKLRDVEVEGFYYIVDACLRAKTEACAQDLVVFAIMTAKPWFHTLGEGYFGLAPGRGYENNQESSLLYQIYNQGMISSKVFGVHTHMFNSTEDPSQIRFGGFNKDLFMEGHDMLHVETRAKSSWEIKFNSAGFYTEEVWKGWHALIDPGYPFIALPKQAFEMFKNDLKKAYPDAPVTCSDDEWCYFVSKCSKIIDGMPDLQFTFPTTTGESATYRVPAASFLFDDRDTRTKLDTCHLGVVRQRFSDLDHFVLGSSFMENFYVVFDGKDTNVNRIGLSANPATVSSETKAPSANPEDPSSRGASGSAASLVVGIIATVVFAVFIAAVTTCICIRKRKQEKLQKAKTYFDSLKTEEEGDQIESDASRTDDNPNHFLKSTSETANEKLVGDLL